MPRPNEHNVPTSIGLDSLNNENLFGDLQDYFRRPAEVDEGTTFTEFFRLWYKVSSAPHFQVVEQQRRGPVHWHGLLIATPPIDPLPTAAHDVET